MAALPSGTPPAAAKSLAGATINPGSYGISSYVDTAHIFDGYIGLPLATTLEKVYMTEGSFPSRPPAKMSQLNTTGCQFVVSIKPSLTLTPSEQSALAKWLAMLNSTGIPYRVVVFSECNDQTFSTASEWLAYWRYYAPVVKNAGVVCGYNPGCNPQAFPRALAYFPSNPAPDELWMDYYATGFRGGSRLDPLIAIAQQAGIPTGIAEWGWSAGKVGFSPMIMPWWNAYGNYLAHLASVGKLPLGAIYFDAQARGGTTGVIKSTSDPRIPMIQKVAQAVQPS